MNTASKKIWITRAQPGADATAARVRALGHQPFVAPLLVVERRDPGPLDLDGVGALAFTSANGLASYCELTGDRSQPVFAVGAATAAAARAAGFKRVLSADGDVAALAEGLIARRNELKGVVLHPGAAEPAGDLAGALARHGIEVRRLILYDTIPLALTEAQLARLPELDLALVHSVKAAQALAKVLKASPQKQLRVLALSKAVIKPLARAPVGARAYAPFPLEAAMLNLIDR
jgi:uroporphyrinogen-III synthase